jgi:hypothetical protein
VVLDRSISKRQARMILKSYGKKRCCGADCDLGTPQKPCWGNVKVVDELYTEDDYVWIHACEGHQNIRDGGLYIKSNLPEDYDENGNYIYAN